MYYKVINNKEIIDIVKDPAWVQIANGMLMLSNEHDAIGLLSSDGSVWYKLNSIVTDNTSFAKEVSIVEISEEEAEDMRQILEAEGKLKDNIGTIEIIEEPEPEPETPEFNDDTIDTVRNWKIKQLSNACEETIKNGVDITWDDGTVDHFSLQLTDQINMLVIINEINNGSTQVLYHADEKPYMEYTTEDFLKIYNGAISLKQECLSHYSSLKNWIKHLDNKHDILSINFTSVVPEEYKL